jgi:ABC-2 type transport system ATP-binding protein
MPELPNLYPHLRAAELLELSGKLAGLKSTQLKKDVPALLEQVGLEGVERTLLRTFSKGMLQRVALAQTLLGDPDLVVLDEPMSGLDPLGRHIVRNVITDLKRRHKTVFFSSHILPDIEALCDRVALIASGTVLRVASVEQLMAKTGSRYEVVLRGVAVDIPADITVHQVNTVGDHTRLVVVDVNQLHEVLEWGRQHGTIVGVAPVRGNLEDIVIEEVRRAEAAR